MPVEMIPLLVCESCHKRVFGDSGFLIVNAVEAARRQREVTHFLAAEKVGLSKPPALVNWHILQRDCAPEATAITSPFFRIWGSSFFTTNDLLETLAAAGTQPWFGGTNWGGLVRRILADTNSYADQRRNVGRKKRLNGDGRKVAIPAELEGAPHD